MWCAIRSTSAPSPTRNSSPRSRKRSPTPDPASQPGRSSVCVTARTVVRRGRQPWRRCWAERFHPVFSLDTGQIISWYGKPAKGPQLGRSADSTSADGSSGTLRFHRHTEPPPSSAVRCCGRSSVHVVHRSQKSVLSPFLNVPLSIEAMTEWETPWVLDTRNQRILGSAWS